MWRAAQADRLARRAAAVTLEVSFAPLPVGAGIVALILRRKRVPDAHTDTARQLRRALNELVAEERSWTRRWRSARGGDDPSDTACLLAWIDGGAVPIGALERLVARTPAARAAAEAATGYSLPAPDEASANWKPRSSG